jgi:hypothetical protein
MVLRSIYSNNFCCCLDYHVLYDELTETFFNVQWRRKWRRKSAQQWMYMELSGAMGLTGHNVGCI